METLNFVRKEDGDFVQQLLDKLGMRYTRTDTVLSAGFTVRSNSMRHHILIEDIFERMIEVYRK
jgi:hypothetical protein